MSYSNKIQEIKALLKSKKISPYIKKFTDVRVQDNRIWVECKLHNNHKINIITPIDSPEIHINVFGSNKLPLIYDGKIRHKFIDIVRKFLEIATKADKGDLYVFLYKFYMDSIKYLNNPHNGYDMPYMDKVNLKADIGMVISKLYGHGKKSQYEQMVKDYHDVML